MEAVPVHAQELPEQSADTGDDEGEEIVVQATRSGRRVEDEPIRVEVIDQEEIEEKMAMVPGNVSMVVAETGGLRVQVTSPALGAANVRVRGLAGRYTQLLADGLPLYGGQSLGLLQIPPTDLGRVEVIKGAASALYGPSALGGVINLVSKRPGADPLAELTLNATSRNGQDAVGYVSSGMTGAWGYSLTGGLHRQSQQDLDGDGWVDMAGYRRATLRPRVFWEGDDGAKAFLTVGAMTEDRKGGTLPGRTVPDGTAFVEGQKSTRLDAGFVGEIPLHSVGTLQLRASAMTQRHRHQFGDVVENDRHSTLFGEVSLGGRSGGTSWLVGGAFQADLYRSRTLPAFDYDYTSPAVFGQVEHDLAVDLTVAGSARVDFHSEYGTRASPRLSVLYKPGGWTIRGSVGRGFFAPTPFVEEIDAAGLSRLESLQGLRAETADTASLDVGYVFGRTELNASVFASRISGAVDVVPVAADRVRLVNIEGITRTAGVELLLRQRWREFSLTASYVHVHASEPDPAGDRRRDVPLTPRSTAGLVGMWEREGVGRVGVEAYYTGRQGLEDDPYRTSSKPYFELGLMGEVVVGPARVFLNLENILGVRQTRYERLLRPSRAPDGRWTVDVWGPTDGFVVNGGIRFRFGGSSD
jgi:iron complex outermembrane receptor protein